MKYEIRYIKNEYGDSTLKCTVDTFAHAKEVYDKNNEGFICREDGKILKRYAGIIDTLYCYKEGNNFILVDVHGVTSTVPAGITTQKGVREYLKANNSENRVKVIFDY